jgi:hypothetical protein
MQLPFCPARRAQADHGDCLGAERRKHERHKLIAQPANGPKSRAGAFAPVAGNHNGGLPVEGFRIRQIEPMRRDIGFALGLVPDDFHILLYIRYIWSPQPSPPDEKANFLLGSLPTNFKCAHFEDDKDTAIVRQLEKDVDAVRFDPGDGVKIELPVKLRVHDSIFVPLAKWSMLLAGNYRCITKDGMRTAQEAVHSNIEESRSVYNFVFDLCVKLGANPSDLVPFEKYAAAA